MGLRERYQAVTTKAVAAATAPVATASSLLEPYTKALCAAVAKDGLISKYAQQYPAVDRVYLQAHRFVKEARERVPTRDSARQMFTTTKARATAMAQDYRKRYSMVDRVWTQAEKFRGGKMGQWLEQFPVTVMSTAREMPNRVRAGVRHYREQVEARIATVSTFLRTQAKHLEARVQPWMDKWAPTALPYAQRAAKVGASLPLVCSVERYVAARMPIVEKMEAWVCAGNNFGDRGFKPDMESSTQPSSTGTDMDA